MIALNRFFEPEQQPIVFFNNIETTTENIYGDCANCGEKHVHIFEHCCEEADSGVGMEKMVQTIMNLEPRKIEYRLSKSATRTLLIICTVIISILIWGLLYV